jgi:SAM-dependent methyltransferase
MNHMTHSNKQGWDKLAEIHTKTYHIDRLLSGEPLLNDLIRSEVGDVRGKSLVHLLCYIGTDTLSWALLGVKVTGIDISPTSLQYARQLAAWMGIDADFIESDIMDVIDNVNRKFDIAFASTGVLCWIQDIERFAKTVRHLLVDGGFFYIHDGHPFRSVMVDEMGEPHPNRIVGDYFRKKVWHYDDLGDYTDLSFLAPTESYEWNW